MRKCSQISKISISEAERLIRPVNPNLSDCFSKLTKGTSRKGHRSNQSRQGLYLAKYTFGARLVCPRDSCENDYLAGFVPPCAETGSICAACKALSVKCSDNWPLFIILNNTIEESLVDPGAFRPRFVPTRLLGAGQILGLSEVLNSLIDSDFPTRVFRAPARIAYAGIRSAYVTVPVGSKQLKDSLKAVWLESHEAVEETNLWASDWDDFCFLKAVSQTGLSKAKSSWDVQVIIIPISWLRSNVFSHGQVLPEARNLLLQLFEMAWKESRGLRSESIRQITLSETARGVHGNTNADLIVQRLLLILRGDAPGFRPAVFSDERLPINAIWQLLLGNENIRKKFFSNRFPALIEPFHLDIRAGVLPGTFFYYPLTSFEQFGHSGNPEDELETMEKLDQLLKQIKRDNRELLGTIRWQFFASPAPLKDQSGRERPRNSSVNFCSAHSSDVIKSDFADQFQSSTKFLPTAPITLLSEPPRKGFMRRFIRVSVD